MCSGSCSAESLNECERRIGYVFRDKKLLRAALAHASGVSSRLESNERLEFLGDAILGAVVCEILYRRFPTYLEGELTRLKSALVSRLTCARIAQQLGLQEFIIAGRGLTSAPAIPRSLLADVFESLVGAIYLDGGLAAVQSFVERHMAEEIERVARDERRGDYKSELQFVAQRDFGVLPTYALLEQMGPDHCKWFRVAAQIGERKFTPAWGRSKKEAEQRAAQNALCELAGEFPPFLHRESL
ncbi:MAG: ribonuclease III [Thermoguttaceae bacterium]|nr:ribonuclease III [Thermoguttaceae bacterium]MDW8077950.1 ribonuclease III [Thermoguttaceae bacterium]